MTSSYAVQVIILSYILPSKPLKQSAWWILVLSILVWIII